MKNQFEAVPLKSLDDWEEDLLRRYPDPENIATAKSTEEYQEAKKILEQFNWDAKWIPREQNEFCDSYSRI